MTDAPEKIWATRGDTGTGSWNAEKSRMKLHMPDDWQIEYTRSDIAQARISKLERIALAAEAMAEAVSVSGDYKGMPKSRITLALAAYREATKN